ncbi:MAG: choice-of-anchor L domain-containing protein [Bacteroidia bacterium]
MSALVKAYKYFLILGITLLPITVYSQIVIEEPDTKNDEVYKYLVKKTLIGNGVLTGHFDVKAPAGSIGLFDFETSKDLVSKGLILSTGMVSDIKGPNDTTNTSTEFLSAGDKDLSNLIGRLTSDAVSVEFDFIPFSDSIGFYYFFASEEYPEYVGKGFNDAFAFLIKGPGYPYYTNIARLKIGPKIIPISIDNINFVANKDEFITNHLKADKKIIKPKSWQKELSEAEMLKEIEFDGMTKKLRATAKVSAGEVYRLKIVIADVGDMRYDSGVFLEKESFGSPVANVASNDSLAMMKTFAYYYRDDSTKLAEFTKNNPKLLIKETKRIDTIAFEVYFDNDEFALLDDHVSAITKYLGDVKTEEYKIYLKAHTDSTAGEDYNLQLSKKRRATIYSLLKNKGFSVFSSEALGETQPKYSNKTDEGRQKNRRVEIILIRK